MMYEQQLAHLPPSIKDLDGLFRLIEDVLEPDRFAVILHDKDLNERGNLQDRIFTRSWHSKIHAPVQV